MLELFSTFLSAESRPVEMPFLQSPGAEKAPIWHIRPADNEEYQKYIKKVTAPVKRAGKELFILSSMNRKGSSPKLTDAIVDAVAPEADTDKIADLLIESVDNLMNDDGTPVEYTQEVGRSLLSWPAGVERAQALVMLPFEPVSDDDLESDYLLTLPKTMGEALTLWVEREANRFGEFRRDEVKEAAEEGKAGSPGIGELPS